MSRPYRQPVRHAPAKMTRAQNHNAAFMAVTMGDIDRLNPAMIARTTGLTTAEVEQMIAERRAREASHG